MCRLGHSIAGGAHPAFGACMRPYSTHPLVYWARSFVQERAAGFPEVVAVVDPPRNGLHRAVLRALLGCTALKRLVYVSCNPDSLARDMAALCTGNPTALEDRAGGGGRGGRGRGSRGGGNGSGGGAQPVPFVPARCAAFDLFPHTRHVEAMVLLERP